MPCADVTDEVRAKLAKQYRRSCMLYAGIAALWAVVGLFQLTLRAGTFSRGLGIGAVILAAVNVYLSWQAYRSMQLYR